MTEEIQKPKSKKSLSETPKQERSKQSNRIVVFRIGQFAGFAVLEHMATQNLRILPDSLYGKYIPDDSSVLPKSFKMSQTDFLSLAKPIPLPDLECGTDIQYGVERMLSTYGVIDWKESELSVHQIRGAGDAAHRTVTKKLQELSKKG